MMSTDYTWKKKKRRKDAESELIITESYVDAVVQGTAWNYNKYNTRTNRKTKRENKNSYNNYYMDTSKN